MKGNNFEQAWIRIGYQLFAEEGIDGLQVERLARILNLNKSGFYHYFGDLDSYYSELLNQHEKNAVLFLKDSGEIKTIDPDYLRVIMKHSIPVLFHIKLIRSKPSSTFYKVADAIDQRMRIVLRDVWADYLGFQDQPELAMRYYNIVRDMMYTRLSITNFTYPFLQSLMTEAKNVMQQTVESKSTPDLGIQVILGTG